MSVEQSDQVRTWAKCFTDKAWNALPVDMYAHHDVVMNILLQNKTPTIQEMAKVLETQQAAHALMWLMGETGKDYPGPRNLDTSLSWWQAFMALPWDLQKQVHPSHDPESSVNQENTQPLDVLLNQSIWSKAAAPWPPLCQAMKWLQQEGREKEALSILTRHAAHPHATLALAYSWMHISSFTHSAGQWSEWWPLVQTIDPHNAPLYWWVAFQTNTGNLMGKRWLNGSAAPPPEQQWPYLVKIVERVENFRIKTRWLDAWIRVAKHWLVEPNHAPFAARSLLAIAEQNQGQPLSDPAFLIDMPWNINHNIMWGHPGVLEQARAIHTRHQLLHHTQANSLQAPSRPPSKM